MNDLFRALYAEYAAHRGDADAYTLTGGRLYRTQVPARYSSTFPYIVVSLVGGSLARVFGDDIFETARLQISVFDQFNSASGLGGTVRAGQIWESMVLLLEHATLFMLDSSEHIAFRREGFPREMMENGVVHLNGDWMLERQVTRRRV